MKILRNDIKRICGELATKGGLKFNLMDCYNYIDNFCKLNKINPTQNIYENINGRLYINGIYIGIVEVFEQKSLNDYQWDLIESLIGYCE